MEAKNKKKEIIKDFQKKLEKIRITIGLILLVELPLIGYYFEEFLIKFRFIILGMLGGLLILFNKVVPCLFKKNLNKKEGLKW